MAERNIDEKVDEKIDLKIEKAQLNSTDGSVPRLPPELQSMSVPPTTTSEEDLRTAGQRKVNMIWEYSQSVFAGLILFTVFVEDDSVHLPLMKFL